MIAMISVRQTADKPNFPLRPLAVFTGSSMTLGIVDVPPTREGIAVTGVSLAVENAAGAVSAAAAIESGGVWTATIPASHFAAVGVVAMGVTISASGTDENGAARSWIVGKGDLTILPADGVPVPGETLQNVHLRDSVPQTPMKGDLCEGAGGWQIYTGDAWAVIAPSPSTSAPLMDGTASAGSSAAYARGDHRHPTDTTRASTVDVEELRTGKRGKLDMQVYGLGNASVAFPDGFSITAPEGSGIETTYTAPTGGETIELFGPIKGALDYYFWVPEEYKDDEDFDPVGKFVWCLYGSSARPEQLIYNADLSYNVADYNSETPSLELAFGVESGGHPTMERPVVVDGTIAKTSDIPAVVAPSTSASDIGKAADAKATGDALAGKLGNSGNQSLGGQLTVNSKLSIMSVDEFGTQQYPVNFVTEYASGVTAFVITINDGQTQRTYRLPMPDYEHGQILLDGTLALTSDLLAKLDSTSAAPSFSADSSVSYAVGSHCTYNGKLYVCTTATTGGTWVAGSWTADTMTDPDAVLDITSQNQLRVVAKDGTLLWAQGYDLASTSSATLACDAANNFTFANGATSQAFTLPTAPTGKVGDFGLDIDNSANASAATLTLTGLDTTFSVVVPEGESLNDMLTIAAGELAQFYFTLTTFRVNTLPTWHILKQVVENGGAQS